MNAQTIHISVDSVTASLVAAGAAIRTGGVCEEVLAHQGRGDRNRS